MTSKSIFLFAHQDDEIGVTKVISNELLKSNNVICIFVTDGGKKSNIRNNESLNVLKKIGVNENNILFLGEEMSISDGKLPKNIGIIKEWISTYIKSNDDIGSIYVTAYEGGHQDHDALHFAVVSVAIENKLIDKVYQFPLYNRFRCFGPFFSVMKPLVSNGDIIKINMTIKDRINTLFYCLQYPSQFKTWIVLFPFFFFYYLINNHQKIQKVRKERLGQKPHKGDLLYEYRKFYRWEDFIEDVKYRN